MAAIFRQYEPADYRHLVGMYRSFEPKGAYMGLPPRRADRIEAWLGGLLAGTLNTHFVLWTGRRVIAHAALIHYPNLPRAQEIIIFVHQDHQRRGWGRRMFLGALNWACFNLDVDEIWLFVDWHNAPARRLYISVGFTGHPPAMNESETLMRRRLHCAPCLRERCPVFVSPFEKHAPAARSRQRDT
jgi:RimJ/RimL family protein N-acetyltransferase